MVPGSAQNWIAVNALQQSSFNFKNHEAKKMKKQINPSIKAHLLRSAFILLSLVAVSVIPFALAQRAATKQNAVAPPLLLGPASVATLPGDAPFTFDTTGSLGAARAVHTATLLPLGKVLVAGGTSTGVTFASAELYDPANGTWTGTGGLGAARQSHTATLLPNGKVLVAGGTSSLLAGAE